MDGTASAPLNLKVECKYFNISDRTTVSAHWEFPSNPNGRITSYHIVLDGVATFRSGTNWRNETYGPKAKSVNEKPLKAEYENVPLNTNYTVRVSAVTRSKRPGDFASASCFMQRGLPEIEHIFWGKLKTEHDKWIIKLYMQRLSERNGPICGYRIYLVRLPNGESLTNKHLPLIDELSISTYHEVHSVNNSKGGAYIAETFSSDNFQPEIILGDGHSIKDNANIAGFKSVHNKKCRQLLNGFFTRQSKSTISDNFKKMATSESPVDGM